MPSGIAENPFLYQPRWAALNPPGIDAATKYILEERDRELEDYLGTLSSSSGGTALSCIALRRQHDQSSGASSVTQLVADCTTTDFILGSDASVGALSGSSVIQIDTAGVWHVTGSMKYTNATVNNTIGFIGVSRSGSTVDAVPGANSTTTAAYSHVAASADFNLQVGDLVFLAVYPGSSVQGPVGGMTVTITEGDGGLPAAHLSAFLVN